MSKRPGALRIGISGWRYPAWRGVFYPQGLPQRAELEYASRQVASIELNGSFYSLQRPSSYACWNTATPRGFVFAVAVARSKQNRDVGRTDRPSDSCLLISDDRARRQ